MQNITVANALELVTGGATIVTAMAAAEPHSFLSNFHKRAQALKGVTLYCANPTEKYHCLHDAGLEPHLDVNVLFLTSHLRRREESGGHVHYVPQHLSRWAHNLKRGPVDIFWGSCSLPDAHGFVSLGTNACYETEILRHARIVILEVNPKMPCTFGSTWVPLSCVDHLIEHDHPLPTVSNGSVTEIDQKIAAYVAELVPAEATLQLGIGSIPNALVEAFKSKKNLGVHTEMLNNALMELTEAGVITCSHKTTWPGKIIASFVYGSQKLYDFVHQNPFVELHPSSVVNDPYRMGRNHRMISINTAVEIDITGQVCSESVGHRELSGVGGATDTHVGAQFSSGGRGIIALHATTKTGQSKIVSELQPGAKVSISRNDIDTVVTEYGVADLKGRSVKQRAALLIGLAHPEHREQLSFLARKNEYL